MAMRYVWGLAILALGGCQEGGVFSESSGSEAVARASFEAAPNELQNVLAELRAKTGWKLTCDPELNHELVFLKFKDKSEREVAQYLGQVLLANYPTRDGALTLSASHAEQINKIMFENEVMRPVIQVQIDRLNAAADAARTSRFATGSGSSDEPRVDGGQVKTPAGRACARLLRHVSENDFMALELEQPLIWSTKPVGKERKMTDSMEAELIAFVEDAITSYTTAFRQGSGERQSGNAPAPHINPRGDFLFQVERGNPQIQDATGTITASLSAVNGTQLAERLAQVTIILDRQETASIKRDPDFEDAVSKITFPNREPKSKLELQDVRLLLLKETLMRAAKGKDNVIANLNSEVLSQMSTLSRSRQISVDPLNPQNILAKHHIIFPTTDAIFVRPKFTIYARSDRHFWNGQVGPVYPKPPAEQGR